MKLIHMIIKLIKVITGTMLLAGSVLYILYIRHVVSVAEVDAVLMIQPYLEVEFLESEYVGCNPVVNGTDDYRRRWLDSGFYKVSFRVKNLSSSSYEGSLDDIIFIDWRVEGVGVVIKPKVEDFSMEFRNLSPEIPGKTSVDFVYYVEVEEGTEMLCASYKPSAREDVTKTLEISLAS